MNDEQVLRVVDELMNRMFGEIEREQREDERLWATMGADKGVDNEPLLGGGLAASAETSSVPRHAKRS
jgi:hypothetical protein